MATSPNTDTAKSRVNRRAFTAEAEATHRRAMPTRAVAPSVQTQLKVGRPNDRYEQEADAVADKVLSLGRAPAPATDPSDSSPHLHTSTVQRQAAPAVQAEFESNEDASIQPKLREGLQRSGGDSELSTSDEFTSRLQSQRGGGQPLPDTVRSSMEQGMGADLSGVRVHTGSEAASLSEDIGARAFTHGSDIYFNQGEYNPGTSDGQHLLAHEATHTVQQGASPAVQAKATSAEVQREASAEDLKKELEAADQAQAEAVDPAPAQQAEEQAKEGLPDEMLEPEETEVKEEGDQKAPEGELPPEEGGDQPKPAPAPEGPPKENLGTVGKDLDQEAANVCGEAEAAATELAQNEQTHDDAATMQGQTEAAVVQPEAEGQALSNTQQVGEVEAKPAPSVSEAEAKRTMDQAVREAVPSDIGSLNEFKSKGKGKVAGAKVMAVVQKDVDKVKDSYNEMEQTPQPTPQQNAPVEIPPPQVAPPTPDLNLGEGAVPELKEEHTDFSNFQQESDSALEKEKITDEQLNMVDKGDLAEAAKERGALKDKVEKSPGEVQQVAKQEQGKVQQDMQAEEKKVKGEMTAERDAKLNQSKEGQKKTKTALELKREAVGKHINGIYEKAQTKVKTRLENLEKDNAATFEREQKKYSEQFEYEVNRDIDRWKDKRYSGLFAGVKWLKDKLFGIDEFPEVKAAFDRGRANFVRKIDALIVRISKDNDKVIQDCKTTLENAKVEIQKYVDGLGPELKAAGEAAQADTDKKLQELDGFIDKKKEELSQKLCDMKDAAIEAIDKKIEEMKASMSGLVNQLVGLLLNAMLKFFKWALEAAGFDTTQLMKILDKGVRVITKIVTDPIGFIMNLVNGVGQGIKNFSANIGKHLKQGLFDWLTGAMSSVPIQLPEKWDLKGIIYLGLQILGLTWDNIRAQLVKEVGEEKVAMAEKTVDIVKRVITEGPIALWEMLKEKAQEMFDTVVGEIRNFVMYKIVEQGIIKILSFLNPAGAIVQAILAIYKAIMFFVDNWDRIVQWVKTIFGAIADIAFGNIGKVAAAVEKGAAMLIPLILDFVAKLLNFDKIADVVQKAIEKIRAPINKGIRKFIRFVKQKLGALVGGRRGNQQGQQQAALSPQERQKQLSAGFAYIDQREKQLDEEKNNAITEEQAQQVAADTKKKHPVFTKITVIPGAKNWDYKYVNRQEDTHKGKSEKEEGGNFEATWQQVWGSTGHGNVENTSGSSRSGGVGAFITTTNGTRHHISPKAKLKPNAVIISKFTKAVHDPRLDSFGTSIETIRNMAHHLNKKLNLDRKGESIGFSDQWYWINVNIFDGVNNNQRTDDEKSEFAVEKVKPNSFPEFRWKRAKGWQGVVDKFTSKVTAVAKSNSLEKLRGLVPVYQDFALDYTENDNYPKHRTSETAGKDWTLDPSAYTYQDDFIEKWGTNAQIYKLKESGDPDYEKLPWKPSGGGPGGSGGSGGGSGSGPGGTGGSPPSRSGTGSGPSAAAGGAGTPTGAVTPAEASRHRSIVTNIKNDLAKPVPNAGSSFSAYAAKSEQVAKLHQRYQPQLRQGINLTIQLPPEATMASASSMQAQIRIAPNDATGTVNIPTPPKKTQITYGGLTNFTFLGTTDKVGTKVQSTLVREDPVQGSDTAGSNAFDDLFKKLQDNTTTSWVRGHLLNHDLGGQANYNNLFPITTSANGEHKYEVEMPIKKLFHTKQGGKWRNNVVKYDVTASKTNNADDSADGKFVCKAEVLEGKDKGKVISKTIHSLTKAAYLDRKYQGAGGVEETKQSSGKRHSDIEYHDDNETYRNEDRKGKADYSGWEHRAGNAGDNVDANK